MISPKNIDTSLHKKQLMSYIATCINHLELRKKIIKELLNTDLFDKDFREILLELSKKPMIDETSLNIKNSTKLIKYKNIINESLNSSIYQLFPYSSPKYDPERSYEEIVNSCQNLNTRLSKLKKINKSLDNFAKNSSQLYWNELQSINFELLNDD